MNCLLDILVFCAIFGTCRPYDVPVGAVFEGSNRNEEIAFLVALDMVNREEILPYQLVPAVGNIEQDEIVDAKHGLTLDYTWNKPFPSLETTCSVLSRGVVGMFNTLLEDNSYAVNSVCDSKSIPVIQTTLQTDRKRECCNFNVFPYSSVLATAFADVVRRWEWSNFTIIYEDQESLIKVTDLLKIYNSTGHSLLVRQLYATEPGNFRTALKEIWRSGQTNLVLDCSIENLASILQQAQQIGLMTYRYNYIIINLNMQTVDLSPYQYSETNITGFRFIDPQNYKVVDLAEAMIQKRKDMGLRSPPNWRSPHLAAWQIEVGTVLMIDAVMLFNKVLKKMGDLKIMPMLCNTTDSWNHGETIFNYMKSETHEGLSGLIQFDNLGVRSDFRLDLIELREGGITKIGTWNPREGLNISRVYHVAVDNDPDSLKNKTFNVAIVKTAPYAMLRDTRVKLTGNDQYEGFAIDIIKKIAELEGFNYTFMPFKGNGDYNKTTNKWTGMMGAVIGKRADLAIADLTITRERQQHVDFTNPFMSVGILILYSTPAPAPPGFFSFAAPLHNEVWGMLTISYFGISLTLFVMARLSPAEWTNPFPCVEEPEYLVNQFNLRNAFWFNLGGIMQQGADIAPSGFSCRILAGFWWFFTLIMVSSYTANLAAFLTTEVPNWPFTNVKELVQNAEVHRIKYGALKGGSTYKFFKNSENDLYSKIGAYMEGNPDVLASTNKLGVEMAEQGNYAFFMESSSVDYAVKGSCNLTNVGQNLDEKSYGIAMRKEMPYRNRLSAAVLKLKETGVIDELKRKWWEENRKKPECEEGEEDDSDAPPLSLTNVGGIFWVSVGGTISALALVFIEMMLHNLKKYGRNRKSCMEEIKDEFRFYFGFKGMVKPVKKRNGDTDSTDSKEKLETLEISAPTSYGFALELQQS